MSRRVENENVERDEQNIEQIRNVVPVEPGLGAESPEVPATDVSVQSTVTMESVILCKTHDWAVVDAPGYSCLDDKKCFGCKKNFMTGKRVKNGDGIWPSHAAPAHWCKTKDCGIAMCNACKAEKDLNSPTKHKRRLG